MNKLENYNRLATRIKGMTESNSELSKGIYKSIDKLTIECKANGYKTNNQDVLFVTMKEYVLKQSATMKDFTSENINQLVLQYFHYLGSLKASEVVEMLNFLDLCRQ